MNFKRFLKEDAEDVDYNGRVYSYTDGDSVVLGIVGRDNVVAGIGEYKLETFVWNNNRVQLKKVLQPMIKILLAAVPEEHLEFRKMLQNHIVGGPKYHHFLIDVCLIFYCFKNGELDKDIMEKVLIQYSKALATKDANGSASALFRISGRYWSNPEKVMSFWKTPSKADIEMICGALRVNPKEVVYEIPQKVEGHRLKFVFKKYDELEDSVDVVEVPHTDHEVSPLKKKKKEVPVGLGSRKLLPGQKETDPTAKARAKLQTSEETT
jgi:hypothetical protein